MKTKYKLPKEFTEKWLDALRNTPEEKHHKGELENVMDRTCHCSIGVGVLANGLEISENGMMIIIDGKRIDYFEGFIFKGKLAYDIVDLNDTKSKTFNQIADWIEENAELI